MHLAQVADELRGRPCFDIEVAGLEFHSYKSCKAVNLGQLADSTVRKLSNFVAK